MTTRPDLACPQCGHRPQAASAVTAKPSIFDNAPRAFSGDVNILRPDADLAMGGEAYRWKLPLVGMRLVFWSFLAFAAAFLPIQITGLTAPLNSPLRGGQALAMVVLGAAIVTIVAALILYVGMWLCCTTPHPPSRRCVWVAVILPLAGGLAFGVAVASALGDAIPGDRGRPRVQPPDSGQLGFLILGAIAIAASWLAWLFFHANLGEYLRNTALVRHSRMYLFVYVANLIVSVALPLSAGRGMTMETFGIIQAVTGSLNAVLVVWYLWIAGLTVTALKAAVRGDSAGASV